MSGVLIVSGDKKSGKTHSSLKLLGVLWRLIFLLRMIKPVDYPGRFKMKSIRANYTGWEKAVTNK